VVGRDLPLAAQARPGTRLRFRFVSLAAARGQLRMGPGPNGRM